MCARIREQSAHEHFVPFQTFTYVYEYVSGLDGLEAFEAKVTEEKTNSSA